MVHCCSTFIRRLPTESGPYTPVYVQCTLITSCYGGIPNHVIDTKTGIQLLLLFVMKYITLFLIVTWLIFSQISKLNLDYCWCLDMFYKHTFPIH